MGNEASKKKSLETKDVLNDDKFSEFESISHPSSPSNSFEKTTHNTTDDMSYSGILVDNAGSIMMPEHTMVTGVKGSAFSPPSKSGTGNVKTNPSRRRIIKATPPPPAAAMPKASKPAKDDDDQDIPHAGKQHLPAVLSPKASSELLQESLEQSKSKRLEQLSREQRSKRDKLLDAKRRGAKTGSDGGDSSDDEKAEKKPKPQPNPFSKFLRVFSVEPEYPHHKRSYEEGAIDREEEAATSAEKATTAASTGGRHSPTMVSKRQKLDDSSHEESFAEKGKAIFSTLVENMPEWVPMATASAAMAVVAAIVALKISSLTSGGSKSY